MSAVMKLITSTSIQTTLFLTAIAVFIQAGLIWFQSRLIKEYRGIRTAALGNFVFGLGILLTSFRDLLSDVVTIVIANYFIVIGAAIMYVAVCKFLNERFSVLVIASAIVPTLTLVPYFTYVQYNFTARIVVVGICTAILIVGNIVRLFRLKQANFRFSAYFLAYVSMVYAIVLVLRNIGFLFFSIEGLFSPTLFTIIHSIALFAASFLWSIGFMMMVSHRLQSDLNELATMDSLTHIANRRAMIALLEAEYSRLARSHVEFSVLLVDVDHFKKVNDQFGHEAGDRILHDVAQLLKSALRKQDEISRWGGEEFLILLPASDLRDASNIGERLRMLVEQARFEIAGDEIYLTISVGVGNSTSSKDVDRIYKSSDIALYKAKLTRNAVALSHELV